MGVEACILLGRGITMLIVSQGVYVIKKGKKDPNCQRLSALFYLFFSYFYTKFYTGEFAFLHRCPHSLYLPLILHLVIMQMSKDKLHFTHLGNNRAIFFSCGTSSNQCIANELVIPIQWKHTVWQNRTN